MMNKIDIREYTYELPAERVAAYPLPLRDQSKLLVYQGGRISHSRFDRLPMQLPENSVLFFNDTKVIPARLIFYKDTGAEIEVFLLKPVQPSHLFEEAMRATGSVHWECTIGNLKRWTSGIKLKREFGDRILLAELIQP